MIEKPPPTPIRVHPRSSAAEDPADPVLSVRDLRVCFDTDEGEVCAVDGVSFDVPRGKVLAVVGESGCGKSVTAYSILRLINKPGRIAGGRIVFHPKGREAVDITALKPSAKELFRLRGNDIAMIFQEPMTALSPVHTLGNQLTEALRLHQKVGKAEARQRAVEMLGRVGIPGPERRLDQYPFELSGGMRQRVVIAMAMMCGPQLLIADEPTTALDVTIQAQVMRLIKTLQRETGTSDAADHARPGGGGADGRRGGGDVPGQGGGAGPGAGGA